jgi:hypothetical protein
VGKGRGREGFEWDVYLLARPTLLQTVLFAGMESVRDAGWSAFPGTGAAFKTPVISRLVVFLKQ